MSKGLGGTSFDETAELVASSVRLITGAQHASGAYPASPNYATYYYCWFRDGSFTADAMSRFGEVASAEGFFEWCARVLVDRADRVRYIATEVAHGNAVETSVLLPARYELNGSDSLAPWSNFQVDGYGTWLRALVDHCTRSRRPLEPYSFAGSSSLSMVPSRSRWPSRVGPSAVRNEQ